MTTVITFSFIERRKREMKMNDRENEHSNLFCMYLPLAHWIQFHLRPPHVVNLHPLVHWDQTLAAFERSYGAGVEMREFILHDFHFCVNRFSTVGAVNCYWYNHCHLLSKASIFSPSPLESGPKFRNSIKHLCLRSVLSTFSGEKQSDL